MTNQETGKHGISDRARDAVHSTRETASHAIDTTRHTASDAAHRASDGVQSNPLAALVGGLAIGAAVGALLPRTRQEVETLGPIGKRVSDAAKAAALAARDAGKQELGGLVPDRANAKEKASSLLGTVIQAARDGAKTHA
jgi:ElaB/YqjD/DUF883 family membrane-anchored ribosome-binding protein